jgi:hypothetical protein
VALVHIHWLRVGRYSPDASHHTKRLCLHEQRWTLLLMLFNAGWRRRGVQKSILERAGPPTFDVAIEMLERGKWRVHLDVAQVRKEGSGMYV